MKNEKNSELALFDFDGTLTVKDSLFDFLSYSSGFCKFWAFMFINIPNFALLKLGLRANNLAKEKLLACFFRGVSEKKVKELCRLYSNNKIDSIVRPQGLGQIKKHLDCGHRVIVVSASLECWLQDWCARVGVELLATKAEFVDGLFTGHFEGKNCHGVEKVERIKKLVKLEEYDYIHAYGDSSGDSEMLSIANAKHYKPFRNT